MARRAQVRGRPSYRVPGLAEVRAVPWNGLTVASTFSGGGGSCCGWRMAGYRVGWANEFVAEAADTYAANWPDTVFDRRNIREVQPEEILTALGMERGELAVLEGSPPCRSFSTAGRREKGWGKPKKYAHGEQVEEDLFLEFARLLDGLRPRAFVAENVPGLARGKAFGIYREVLARLRSVGYRVASRLVDASRLGVPQSRVRLIFIGLREDMGVDPPFPVPLPFRHTIRDALPWIGNVEHDTGGLFSGGEVADRPSSTITIGVRSLNASRFKVRDTALVHRSGRAKGKRHALDEPEPTIMAAGLAGAFSGQVLVETASSMEGLATGREWKRLTPGGASSRYFQLVRADPSLPCPTVTAAGGNPGLASVAHPTECRKFSIDELKRLCAFPADYVLTGTYAQRWERLGNAVPPPMMAAIARALFPVLSPCLEA